MESFALWVLAGVVALVLQYLVIRWAVVAALKSAAIWKADGGVEKVLADRDFARSGLRPTAE